MAAPPAYPSFHPSTRATPATTFAILDHPSAKGILTGANTQECIIGSSRRLPSSSLREFPFQQSGHHQPPDLTAHSSKQPIVDPLDSLAQNVERIMQRLDALETWPASTDRHRASQRQVLDLDPDPPYEDYAEDEFTFADFQSGRGRNKGVATSGFNAEGGGCPRFGRTNDFGTPDFNHFQREDSCSRRGAFLGAHRRAFGRAQPRAFPDTTRFPPRQQPQRSSWDRPFPHPHSEEEDHDDFRQQAGRAAPMRRDRSMQAHVELPKGIKMEAPHFDGSDASSGIDRVQYYFDHVGLPDEELHAWTSSPPSFSSWGCSSARLQFDDYEELRHHASWEAPRRQESERARWRESGLSSNVSSCSVSTPAPPSLATHEPATLPTQPIYVSAMEKAERAKRRLCFYCPEKWVQGHVCQTRLLAYFEEDDLEEQNRDDDRAPDEEDDNAQSELPVAEADLPVTEVRLEVGLPVAEAELPDAEAELPVAKAELPDAEAELLEAEDELPFAEAEPLANKVELHSEVPQYFAEPVVKVLKRTVHPCMSAVPKLHPSPALLACTYEALYQGPFGLVESMESIWFHVLISRRVFDPGGDISPPLTLCFTSSRSSCFAATWYPP